jgi:hypothetical protein
LAEDSSIFNGLLMPLTVFVSRAWILAVCLLALAACSTEGPATTGTSYTLPATPGGRLCVAQCQDALEFCHQDCSLDQRRCVGDVQMQALKDYDKYTREQFTAHQPIELRPHDFERTTPCDDAHNSCLDKCENPYQQCYQSCGGTVNATTSCQAFCF